MASKHTAAYNDRNTALGLMSLPVWVPDSAINAVLEVADAARIEHLTSLLDDPASVEIMAARNRVQPGPLRKFEAFVGHDTRYLPKGEHHQRARDLYNRYKDAHATYVNDMLAAVEAASTGRSDAQFLAAVAYISGQRFKAAARYCAA